MPAKSERQRRFFGAELSRKRAGKKTKTGMTESQLEDYASTPKAKIPEVKQKPHGSGEFTAEDIRRGYKKGARVTEDDLCDATVKPVDEYGRVGTDS
jgi:hypothetical protein